MLNTITVTTSHYHTKLISLTLWCHNQHTHHVHSPGFVVPQSTHTPCSFLWLCDSTINTHTMFISLALWSHNRHTHHVRFSGLVMPQSTQTTVFISLALWCHHQHIHYVHFSGFVVPQSTHTTMFISLALWCHNQHTHTHTAMLIFSVFVMLQSTQNHIRLISLTLWYQNLHTAPCLFLWLCGIVPPSTHSSMLISLKFVVLQSTHYHDLLFFFFSVLFLLFWRVDGWGWGGGVTFKQPLSTHHHVHFSKLISLTVVAQTTHHHCYSSASCPG